MTSWNDSVSYPVNTQALGWAAEDEACDYLQKQGLRCVTRNFRSKMGEIDLIMRDARYLIFVEVRSRSSAAFGGAIASVTRHKQKKIIKTALYYLSKHKSHAQEVVRFDVITIEGKPPVFQWIQNAFWQEG